MAWSTAWAARAVSNSRTPVYILRVLSDGAQPEWSSHPWPGCTVMLNPLMCSIQWGSTGPHRWQQPVSSATFALTADASIEGVYQGSVLQLSIALGGEEQPVWVGSLQQASRSLQSGYLMLRCVGMEGALWSRMIELGASGYKRRFFDETDPNNSYAVAVNYTAGSGTITLAGGPTLRRRTGGSYCIRVEPTGGDPFYLLGSSWSDPTFTISTAGALDTVDHDAVVNDVVRVVAYDAAHPCALASRALAANSSWPGEWNMGLPGNVWDATDASAQAAGSGLSTAEQETYTWAAEEPMERIGDVLGPLLSSAGCVICQRQGRITARIIPSPEGINAGSIPAFDRTDIVDATWEAWAVTPQTLAYEVYDRTKREPLNITTTDDITTPYGALTYACSLVGVTPPPPPKAAGAAVTSATTGSNPPVLAGQPVQDTVEVRLPIYGSSSANRQAAREDVHQRVKWYSTHRPERLTLTLRGWHPYCIGEAVTVDLPELPCRGSGPGGITTAYPAVIVGGGPDYFGATTTYELLAVPTNTDT